MKHPRFEIILFIILPLLLLSFVATEAAADIGSEVEETLICLCGCGQTIKNCPHENCGFAIPARERIASLIDSGKNKDEIIAVFLDKYGDEVLAAPRKEGFNLLGYIMPFAALLASAALIVMVVKSWAARGIRDEEETIPMAKKDFGSDIDRKIEKEIEDMD